MAKIPRVTAKIFAGKAQENDLGQFGSALTGTKITNTDISVLQELPAYEEGWRSAVISNRNYPTLQEMNSVQRITSQQVAYTLQNGMPEWDEGTTYYTNQFCRVGTDFYFSKLDNNLGNNPTLSPDEWELWSGGGGTGGSSRNIGELIYSLLPQTDAGLHLLDGTLINGIGSYRAFVSYIANLYGDGTNIPAYFTTEEEWQQSVTNYGVCGKFVFNQEAYTVRLPKVTGLIEGTLDANALGNLIEAGLPALDLAIQSAGAHTHTRGTMNITGSITQAVYGAYGANSQRTGAFSSSTQSTTTGSGNPGQLQGGGDHNGSFRGNTLKLDASRQWTGATSSNGAHTHAIIGNSIIGKTDTVQPQAINGYIYMVIANAVKTEIEVDIDNIINDLTLKAETDLSNLTPAGEKHFLGEHNISNNIKSAPQLVKWKLENGLLTLLTGSIATFAAGKEAPTLNIGDSFHGLEVVDISWDGTNLFYYCKTLQNYTWTFDTYTGLTQIFLRPDTIPAAIWGLQTDKISSGTNPPTSGNYVYYNSNTNMCSHPGNGIQSFPLMEVFLKSGMGVTTIREVYQTGGKIGSTVWLNKNVSMNLINTIDSQCGLNSIEYTTEHIFLETLANNFTRRNTNWFFGFDDPNTNTKNIYLSTVNAYNVAENFVYNALSGNSAATYQCCIGTNFTIVNGSIISYSPRMPFRAADAQDIDGRWIESVKTLFKGTPQQNYAATYDLSDYLPNDGKVYEVMVEAVIRTGNATGNCLGLYVQSSVITNATAICRAVTRTASNVVASGSTIFPVGSNHTITFLAGDETNAAGYTNGTAIALNGYRKVR